MKLFGVKSFAIGAGLLTLLGLAGYWYVFIAQAPPLNPPPTDDPSGNLSFEVKTFQSKAMGMPRRYGVILPPRYRENPQKRYPVIFMLHGGHDNERAWVDKIGILPVLDRLYQTKKLPPSIVITPDGNDLRGSSPFFDPQYYDGPNGKVGTLIGSELPLVVQRAFRTQKSPRLWAIGGLSSGGWGALNIGLRHLDQFNVFFSQIGYFKDKSGPENSPNAFIRDFPTEDLKSLRIYIDAGKDDVMDPTFLNSSREFHETLKALKVNHVFHAFPGGHGLSGPDFGWNYDHKHAADSLTYVGQNFKEALAQQSKNAQ
jgi:enterochelin esterase-like enzyme